MIHVNNSGSAINDRAVRLILRDTDIQKVSLLDCKIFMHPLQMMMVCALAFQVIDPPKISDAENHIHMNTLHGVEIVEDPHMVKDEIHWRNKDNVIVAKITGLKVPDVQAATVSEK